MPYKSEAQRRFFNSEAGKKKIGAKEVEHWNKESKGLDLPEKVSKDCSSNNIYDDIKEVVKDAQREGYMSQTCTLVNGDKNE